MNKIEVNAVDLPGAFDWNSSTEQIHSLETTLHEGIFSPPPYPLFQSSHEFKATASSSAATNQRISSVAHITIPSPRVEGGGSVEGGVTYSWGGEEGGKWSGHGSAEVHDNNGNYIEGEARQNGDGTGSASVRGGTRR